MDKKTSIDNLVEKVKSQKKRITVYLPVPLIKKIKYYCVENEKKLSNVIEDIVTKHFNA